MSKFYFYPETIPVKPSKQATQSLREFDEIYNDWLLIRPLGQRGRMSDSHQSNPEIEESLVRAGMTQEKIFQKLVNSTL